MFVCSVTFLFFSFLNKNKTKVSKKKNNPRFNMRACDWSTCKRKLGKILMRKRKNKTKVGRSLMLTIRN